MCGSYSLLPPQSDGDRQVFNFLLFINCIVFSDDSEFPAQISIKCAVGNSNAMPAPRCKCVQSHNAAIYGERNGASKRNAFLD